MITNDYSSRFVGTLLRRGKPWYEDVRLWWTPQGWVDLQGDLVAGSFPVDWTWDPDTGRCPRFSGEVTLDLSSIRQVAFLESMPPTVIHPPTLIEVAPVDDPRGGPRRTFTI